MPIHESSSDTTMTHNPFGEDYWASCLRENLTSSSYGKGLETGRASAQEPRQSFTRQCYFRDCKQLLGLGKGQSETFDAVVAWASIVAIRYLILIYILAKRQITGPVGPLFQELAHEYLQLALIQSLWTRIRHVLMLSTQLVFSNSERDNFFYLLDILEN